MKHPVPGVPSSWLTYVDVADVKAATDQARSLGGQVLKDVTDVPGMGSFSIILDPTGAALGLWQSTGNELVRRWVGQNITGAPSAGRRRVKVLPWCCCRGWGSAARPGSPRWTR